ncbi:hypothetical protein PG996_012003 [Apiospora saccharicola]|uniref:N-acetyltransferase domain-containing protein n=1 Tax=Apiospora saccharicola TaxID=335842 RepID=A0ABR1U1W6_9PEZI
MEYMTTGVETEPDAEKSHSVVRLQMMMKLGNFVFAATLPRAGDEGEADSEISGDPTAIGFIGITRAPEVFFIFGRASWGKGYATEALEAFLAAYWSKFPNGLQQIDPELKDVLQAHVVDENLGSSRVLEKVGFKQIGTTTGQIGDRTDVLERVYEIRRPSGHKRV